MKVSGKLTEKEVRRVLSAKRASTIGPTTVYYAGVTAPIISAGMAIFSKTALQSAGLHVYWAYFASSLIAAFAGISWYLIFMRWATRDRVSRDGETEIVTEIELAGDVLTTRRGGVETRISGSAIAAVEEMRRHVHVSVTSGPDIVLPHRWFSDEASRKAFVADILTLAGKGSQG